MVRKRLRLPLFLCALALVAQVRADLRSLIPDDWFTRPPTPKRIKAVQAAAGDGWEPLAGRLFDGALRGYELRQEEAAFAWYHVARWCELLGRSQRGAARQWLETVSQARLLHAGVDQAHVLALPDAPLARMLPAEAGAWLLGDREFSEAFFERITTFDLAPGVLSVLRQLFEADPRLFGDYRQLALAIALVYDSPPPSHWPHWQVETPVLPRRLPAPVEAFRFFTDADKAGRTLHRLGTIGAAELRFMVDLAAPFPELAWAQRSVKFSLNDLAKSYDAVRYRMDRIEAQEYVWPGSRYELPGIYSEGGICVDQAYFATQAGKARGVPTLLFSGAGRDGRHAWFGYLGTGRKWVLDAGRYAEQRYVTGVAIDPQTWALVSDHELVFLSEGFRRLPAYRLSRQHLVFAELYLNLGKNTEAAAAARKAVNHERRNFAAWNLLLAAREAAPAGEREALLREAAMAMQRYPDLNAHFVRLLAASLRERGQVSAAEFEERSLVRRGQTRGRTDLGVEHAATLMAAATDTEQLRVYRQVLQQYGRDAGIDFYDRVTRPLLRQMIGQRRKAEAQQVVALTRAALAPEPGSQFAREFEELAAEIK